MKKTRVQCPYCGGKATLIEGYWPTGNEYRARWLCVNKDAASQLAKGKFHKDVIAKALDAAKRGKWEPYPVVSPKLTNKTEV